MDETADLNVSLFLIMGTMGMLLLAASVVLFIVLYQKNHVKHQLKLQRTEANYQKELLKAIIYGQEKERRRVAQDLHDDIGAMLSTIKLSLNLAQGNETSTDKFQGPINETKDLIDETIDNVRRISRNLMPITLEEFGFIHALTELANRLSASTQIVTSFQSNVDFIPFEARDQLALYRVVQELCNNIIKHSNATRIDISLNLKAEGLHLEVDDNGMGFKPEHVTDSTGVGLKSIESRLSMLVGTIKYDSFTGTGTKVHIEIPF